MYHGTVVADFISDHIEKHILNIFEQVLNTVWITKCCVYIWLQVTTYYSKWLIEVTIYRCQDEYSTVRGCTLLGLW